MLIVNKAREAAACAQANCASSFTNATNAATSAAAAAESAAIAGIYLGPYSVAPTTDNNGDPLQEGMLYYNTVSNAMFVWNGTSWQNANVAVGDGDKGDITVSGVGTVWTIDDDAVTYAKIQNVSATDRLLGRDSAGAGNIEELTVGGGVEFTGSGGIQTSAFTGDVTKSSGGTTTTIANDAVTFAKMQNISSPRLLGRATAGTGDVEQLTLGNGLSFSGTALNGFNETTNFTATGTTTDRNLVTRMADVANVLDFGADPTGVTDSRTAILDAIATNKNVFFPKGTYKFVVVSTNALTPTAKSTLFGMGAEIKFETANTVSFFNIFNLNQGDVTIRDLKLTWTTPSTSAGGIGLFAFNAGNNYTIDNIVAYLDTQEIAGVRNAPNHIFMINANCSDVYISNSKFTRSAFGIVKTNASIAINKNWEFNSNIFENFFSSQLNFNTPNGDWDNVRVINNEIRNSLAHTLGPSAFIHFGGLAGGPSSGRFVWANNTFTGTGQGLHFEEGAEEVIIDGNTFATTDIAIQILDNNVGGTWLNPKKFIISNNTIVQTGTKVKNITNRGIDLIWEGTPNPAINDIIITGNVIDNWEIGIYSAEEPEKYIINSNLISNCDVGIQANFGNANISGNTIRECPVGIYIYNGGLIGKNYFVKCTKEYDYQNVEGAASAGFELYKSYTIATGTNSYKIIDLPIRFNGKLVFLINASGSRRFCVYDIQYDGTTFTGGTALISGGSGNFSTPVISVTTTELQFTTNNTSGSPQSSNVKLSFEGGLYYK